MRTKYVNFGVNLAVRSQKIVPHAPCSGSLLHKGQLLVSLFVFLSVFYDRGPDSGAVK